MVKPNFEKMYIEHGYILPAMVQVTNESAEPFILQNPLFDPYTNNLRALGMVERGSWMNTYTCQPPAVELPIWVKWDNRMVKDRIVKKKDGSGVKIKDVATVVEQLLDEEKK